MKSRRTTGGESAFTLLEVVLSLGILLLGVSAVLGLLTFGAALTHAAHARTAAANLTEAVVADLEETLFPLEDDGSAGEPVTITARALPGFAGVTYDAVPTPNPDDDEEYRVDVNISWESGGVLRGHDFSILLTRAVPFGERMRRRFVEGRDPASTTLVPPADEER